MTARPGARIVRAPRVVTAERSADAVLIDVEHGRRHALNALGASIWRLLAEEPTLPTLVDRLWTEYDVPAAALAHDVAALLAGWDADGLIDWR